MTGGCPQCGDDPGFDWAVCPGCGYRPGGGTPASTAPAATFVSHGDGDRWDKTIIEPAATPLPRERAHFSGRGDFYTPVGATGGAGPSPTRPASARDDRTVLDHGGGFYGGSGLDDRTIIDRGGRAGPDEDGDATVIIRSGRRGVTGPLVYLVQRNGIRAGRVYLLSEETEIGRAADCDIVLGDETVSKRHAKVRKEDGRFVYWDLASANHSYLLGPNGQRTRILEPHPLTDGDTVDLGDVRLTYLEVDTSGED